MASGTRRHRKNYNQPGDAHELTWTCYRRYEFLKAERSCRWLAHAIDEGRAALDFAVWAYVFMPEHVHIIVYPRQKIYDIAKIRAAMKEPVGRRGLKHLDVHAPEWLPRLTRKRGQRIERLFWQSGGGHDRNIDDPKTLAAMIDYIHLNPVRRGLVERAREWKWSSAAWFAGVGESPLRLDPIPSEWTVQE